MTAMNIFNLILAFGVVAGLAAVCRAAYIFADHRHEPAALETTELVEMKRAA